MFFLACLMDKNTPYYWKLDSAFDLWFLYWLRYQPKVSANLGFGFGIRPKPKYWFRSCTMQYIRFWGYIIHVGPYFICNGHQKRPLLPHMHWHEKGLV